MDAHRQPSRPLGQPAPCFLKRSPQRACLRLPGILDPRPSTSHAIRGSRGYSVQPSSYPYHVLVFVTGVAIRRGPSTANATSLVPPLRSPCRIGGISDDQCPVLNNTYNATSPFMRMT